MSTAVRKWPFPEKRPGAVPRRRLQKVDSRSQPFEYSNRCWTDSPESVLEVPPTAPIASGLLTKRVRIQ